MARPALFQTSTLLVLFVSAWLEPTLDQAARRAGISTETIRRWRRAGRARVVPSEVRLPHPDGEGQWVDYGGLTFAEALERALAHRQALVLATHVAIIRANGERCVCGGPARPGHVITYDAASDTFAVEVRR